MTENGPGPGGGNGTSENEWGLSRRNAIRLGGAGIAGAGLLEGATDTVSAATECANGPFTRAYPGGTVTLSELPSADDPDPDTPDAGPEVGAASANPLSERERTRRRARYAETVASEPASKRVQQETVGSGRPEAREGEGIRVGTEYDGVGGAETRGGVPSDSQIATNEDRNVHALNRNVAVFDKDTGEREVMVRLEDIWGPVIPEPTGGFVSDAPFVFDPRARYDRNEDRFVICATQLVQGIAEDGSVVGREEIEEGVGEPGPGDEGEGEGEEEGEGAGGGTADGNAPEPRPARGYFVVAVSATSDPTGKWHVYRFPPEDAQGPDNLGLVDYPTLGLDRDAVYVGQNFFPDDGSSVSVSLAILDKASMYEGEAVTVHHFDDLDNPRDGYIDFTVQPAFQPFSGGSEGAFYMVNSVFPRAEETPPASTLTLWEVTDPIDDPALECFIVETDVYTSPPPARQPDSEKLIDTLGRRLMNSDYDHEAGSLWTAHASAIDWNGDGNLRAAIRWYEIDVESRSLVQSGIYGEPGRSYFIPTLRSNDDSMIMTHNVSGPATFPRMDVAGRTADFVGNQLEDAVVIEDGETRYDYGEGADVMRWGDYNGVSVDPETGHFWTISQYSPDVSVPPEAERRDPYHTRIAEVSFSDIDSDPDEGTSLRIEGGGEYAYYSFRVSGGIEAGETNGEDDVDGNAAAGAVGGGADTYTVTGDVEVLYVQDGATVFLDGEEVDPDAYESTVRFEGRGSYAEYSFELDDGEVTDTRALTGEDEPGPASASGAVRNGTDAYRLTGTFASLSVGDLVVVLNGRPVDPSTL